MLFDCLVLAHYYVTVASSIITGKIEMQSETNKIAYFIYLCYLLSQ